MSGIASTGGGKLEGAAAAQRQREAANGSGTGRAGRWEQANARAAPGVAEGAMREQWRGGFRAAMVSCFIVRQ